ncbi:MAG: hypothetical protein AAF702_28290 [Chloroflexota bacterium]
MNRIQTIFLIAAVGLILVGCLQIPGPEQVTDGQNQISAAEARNQARPSLPSLLQRKKLGDPSAFVVDMVLDSTMNRLYVMDSLDQIYHLNGDRLNVVDMVASAPGYLHLDEAAQRLYVEPREIYWTGDGPPQIQVIDLKSMALLGSLWGRYVAIDRRTNQLFTGIPIRPEQPEAEPIRIYDGETLLPRGELSTAAGVPVNNPYRDDLLVLAYSAYAVDTETGDRLADLAPDISNSENRWLVGSPVVSGISVDSHRGTIRLDIGVFSSGAGAGILPPPRLFDAATLAPISDPLQLLSQLNPTIDGHLYRHSAYSRYVTFHNWHTYDEAGVLRTWSDGMGYGLLNLNTGQLYRRGDVVNLKTGQFDGTMPSVELWFHDVERGRLYATSRSEEGIELLLFADTGGDPLPTIASESVDLPPESIWHIAVSPTYAEDQTILVQLSGQNGGTFRTTDRGESWIKLIDRLPQPDSLSGAGLAFAFSPSFASDQTLFVAGSAGEHKGHGVLRSTDGGLTWIHLWNGLTHLRTESLAISPNFEQNQTVLVQSAYYHVDESESGHSIFQSTDGGLHWSLVLTTTEESELPLLTSLLPGTDAAIPLPLRIGETGQLERMVNSGQSWQPLTSLTLENPFGAEFLASPSYSQDRILYLRSESDLWRTRDDGGSWQKADWTASGITLPPDEYGTPIRSWAISPELVDGTHHLFFGTWGGELILIQSSQLVWLEDA